MHKPITAGIVAEYNPFHTGHQWMIQQLRRGGIHTVVCVMSGPFVQRAEAAQLPVPVRAKAALAGGADLIIRLPVQWAAASAEGFAAGAVGLLSALGCVDVLAFGAETPEIDQLGAVAAMLLEGRFSLALKRELASGVPFAAARSHAANKLLPGAGNILRLPNNILAVEYCKALLGALPGQLRALMPEEVQARVVSGLYGKSPEEDRLFPLPVPLALPRAGAAHDGEPQDGFASASWLRAHAAQHGMAGLSGWVPYDCLKLYCQAEAEQQQIDPWRFDIALLARLRGQSAAAFARHPGAGEGLENRLAEAALHAASAEELYAAAKAKRFAHSRVRRLALAAALGLPRQQPVIPPFAQVLAANGRGLALLRTVKQNALVPVGTSLAKLAKTGEEARRTAAIEAAAEDFYALCQKRPRPGGGAYTRPASIQMAK